MLRVKIVIFDAGGMGVVDPACQSEVFAEQEKLDFVSYGVEGEVEDSIGDSCHAGMKADTGDVVLDSEVFGGLVGKDTGQCSSRMLVFVCRVTEQSMSQLVSANHSGEALELGVEEEVDRNRSPDMKMAMHKVRLDFEDHCSLVRNVCLARLAEDGYILESPAEQDQLGLA